MKKNKLLLLGHHGFIGSAILPVLRRNYAEWDIQCLSSKELDLTDRNGIDFLTHHLREVSVLVVCSGLKKQHGDSIELFRINMLIAANLCGALESVSLNKIIYISSTEVYGNHFESKITEETQPKPSSYYGLSKYMTECLLRAAVKNRTTTTITVLRPPLIYGAGDRSLGYGPTGFAHAAVKRLPITLWGDGLERRQFVYVDDLAEAVSRLVGVDFDGILNVAADQEYTFSDIISSLRTLESESLDIVVRDRTQPQVNTMFANARIRSILPGFVFTSLDSGLAQTLAGLRRL